MPFTIGQAAARSDCTPPTIRYYEDIGLLRSVDRTANGRRAYGWPQIHRLTFIRRSRDLGLSLEQVRLLLDISDGDQSNCGDARDLIENHLERVKRKRAELEGLEGMLTRMADRCDSTCASDPGAACSVFADVLSQGGEAYDGGTPSREPQ